jgi:hypothetical protein
MRILSRIDSPVKFFQSLKVGEIFGFSQQFKRDDVMGLSLHHGIRVTPPSKLTPERKQYGDYVLKVRGNYPSWDCMRQAPCGEYKAVVTKRALKCQSNRVGDHTIPKNSIYVVRSLLGKDKNYCVECATLELRAHVKHIEYFLNRIGE